MYNINTIQKLKFARNLSICEYILFGFSSSCSASPLLFPFFVYPLNSFFMSRFHLSTDLLFYIKSSSGLSSVVVIMVSMSISCLLRPQSSVHFVSSFPYSLLYQPIPSSLPHVTLSNFSHSLSLSLFFLLYLSA